MTAIIFVYKSLTEANNDPLSVKGWNKNGQPATCTQMVQLIKKYSHLFGQTTRNDDVQFIKFAAFSKVFSQLITFKGKFFVS